MRTISFYSYKGGTGRTLLVANIAIYAARLGKTVVMVDLDLEAPGLPYKFDTNPSLRPGVVDWLSAPDRPDVADLAESIDIHEPFNAGGQLWLIAAGRAPSMDYLKQVRSLQSTAFDDYGGKALVGLLDLRDAIAQQFTPDLLLLDARTGISNTNAITTRVLADDVVTLTLKTPEQLEGTREVLRSLAPLHKPGGSPEKLGLHVVLSRVTDPPRGIDDSQRAERDAELGENVRQILCAPADPLSATLTLEDAPLLLHNDVALAAEEHLLLAEVGTESMSRTLHFDYLRVAATLLGAEFISPAVEEAFEGIDDAERLQRGTFFGDLTQILAAKAPAPLYDIRPAPGGSLPELQKKVYLLRSRVATNPVSKPELAGALVELAWAHFDARASDEQIDGLKLLREATLIYRELAADVVEYLPITVDTQIQCSAMAAQLGRFADATSAAVGAVDVASADEADQISEVLLAKALANLAAARYQAGENDLALDPIARATSIFDGWVANPATTHTDLLAQAGAANNLRTLIEMSAGNLAQARESAERARLQCTRLEAERPADTSALAGLGRALANLADLSQIAGEHSEAVAVARKAVEIFAALAAQEPQIYLRNFAAAFQTLSVALADLGHREEALDAADQAVHLWGDVAEISTQVSDRAGLISALDNLAARWVDLDQYQSAAIAVRRARELADEALSDIENGEFAEDRAIRKIWPVAAPAYADCATIFARLGQYEEALDAARTAARLYHLGGFGAPETRAQLLLATAEIYNELLETNRAYDAAMNAAEIAAAHDLGAIEAAALLVAARSAMPIALDIAAKLAKQSMSLYQSLDDLMGLAQAYSALAEIDDERGDPERAAKSRAQVAALRRAFLDPKTPRRDS